MWIKRKLISLYEWFYERYKVVVIHLQYGLPILSWKKTLQLIQDKKCSIARFGDGELGILLNCGSPGFQKGTPQSSERLQSVLSDYNSHLLVCMPHFFNYTYDLSNKAKIYWNIWAKNNQIRIVSYIREKCRKDILFGDTQFTRPYMDYLSKTRAKKIFDALKRLWDKRDLLIVEGEQTRLGIGNDLFANAKSIKRILAPAENAFARYDDILAAVKYVHNGELILLALGPTATILAADLATDTCQAIDIGHIDIEYEWYLSGATEKTAIVGKYTNEVADGHTRTECLDENYLAQITKRIC